MYNTTMSLLDIKNYSMSFRCESGIYNTLNNISLSIPQKSMVALVGESGCGKSMTAMSILRLLPKNALIDSGQIIFDNKNLLELKEKEMRNIRGNKIALIPQDPMTSLNPLYTIGNQLLEVIEKDKTISRKDAINKAVEVLEIVKIPKAKDLLFDYKEALKQKEDEIEKLKKSNQYLYNCIQGLPKIIKKLFIKDFNIKLLNS